MTDETFRPQKRSIDPSEVSDGQAPEENAQETLDKMAEMRAAASAEQESLNDTNNLKGEVPQQPNAEPGIKVEGAMPPAFRQALERQKQGGQQPNVAGDSTTKIPQRMMPERNVEPANPSVDPSTGMRLQSGNEQLERLISGLVDNTRIYDEIKLPSLGRFYDGSNGPADGIIHLRPMTGEEEQILATPRFVKNGQALNMIFNRCMQESQTMGWDASNFLTQDRTYILIFLRGISYSTDYDVEVRDPDTDQKFAHTISLSNDIFVDYCPDWFGDQNLEGTLPTSGYSYKYRMSRGSDEQEVNRYREFRIKGFDTAGQADDTLLYRTAMLIEDIEGISETNDIMVLLKKLPINDVNHLRNVVNEPPFGVNTTIEITSPYTLQEFEIELPLEANFFFPRGRKNQNPKTQQ
jgi:hypothetical protein